MLHLERKQAIYGLVLEIKWIDGWLDAKKKKEKEKCLKESAGWTKRGDLSLFSCMHRQKLKPAPLRGAFIQYIVTSTMPAEDHCCLSEIIWVIVVKGKSYWEEKTNKKNYCGKNCSLVGIHTFCLNSVSANSVSESMRMWLIKNRLPR